MLRAAQRGRRRILLRARLGLEFVARCAGDDPLPAVIADFRRTIAAFGFVASACGAWVWAGDQRKTRFFFIDWPQDWHDLYMSKGWLVDDFVISEVARRMTPFLWEDVRAERELTEKESEVYAGARKYGWVERLSVPIHGPVGYQAVVTMTTKESLAVAPEERAVLQTMALTIHERCRSVIGLDDMSDGAIKLTKREIECLQWVAAGKTDWEIGQLLQLAAATVHFHVERAKKKLNTRTRAQAVALLVLLGLL
jgi:DNA-binding CsgD family transcriptional regulator